MKISIEAASIEELIQVAQQLSNLNVVTVPSTVEAAAEGAPTPAATTQKKKTKKKKVARKDASGKKINGRPSEAQVDAELGEGAYADQLDEKQLREVALQALQDLNLKKGVESCRGILQRFKATRISEVDANDLPAFTEQCQNQVAEVGA